MNGLAELCGHGGQWREYCRKRRFRSEWATTGDGVHAPGCVFAIRMQQNDGHVPIMALNSDRLTKHNL